MTSWSRCWLARFLTAACRRSFAALIFRLILTFSCEFLYLDNQGHPKRSQQETRDKRRAPNRAVLTHPDQLAVHILKITTTAEDLRVTCNSGVSFRNRYDCWSQWPIQCNQLWSQFLLFWIWTSLFIYLFIYFFFTIECQYQTDEFCPLKFSSFSAFASVEQVQDWAAIFIRRLGLLNVEKKWVNNFKRIYADRIV